MWFSPTFCSFLLSVRERDIFLLLSLSPVIKSLGLSMLQKPSSLLWVSFLSGNEKSLSVSLRARSSLNASTNVARVQASLSFLAFRNFPPNENSTFHLFFHFSLFVRELPSYISLFLAGFVKYWQNYQNSGHDSKICFVFKLWPRTSRNIKKLRQIDEVKSYS